jgi:threonine/homoserine/homoserine lactone efflux protein
MPLNLTLGPLALFVFVASITPGPNNLLLMRSGARFGVAASVPHLIGIHVGFQGLLWLSHLGIGALLLALPAAFTVLRWACFGYLLYLSFVIWRDAARSAEPQPAAAANTAHEAAATPAARPMRWIEATLFQLINAKAWMMTVTVATAFYSGAEPTTMELALASVVCFFIGIPSMLVWNVWGASIDRVLKQPRYRRLFNYAMALLVLATAVWMLF